MIQELVNNCETYIEQKLKFITSSVLDKPRTLKLREIDEGSVLDYVNNNKAQSFSEQLFFLIDQTGEKDSDIYKRAHVDRRLFSKIRKGDYIPCKKTIISLSIGLKLNIENTNTLLISAGYALSNSDIYDLVISFCIENNIYDVNKINELLIHFDLELL